MNRIAKALFYGQIVGLLYFISTLIFFWPREELLLVKTPLLKLHFFLYSISFWVIFYGFILVVALLIGGIIDRSKSGFFSDFLSVASVLFVLLSGYGVYFYYYYGTPPLYPLYLLKRELKWVVFFVLAVSIIGGITTAAALRIWRKIKEASGKYEIRFRKCYKLGVLTFSFLFMYVMVSSGLSRFALLKGDNSTDHVVKRVVVLGLDGASWNILVPLLKEGGLVNIRNLIGESAYGYLDTYGKQFTPSVWTSIATGKTTEKHGVSSFDATIFEWRAKPIWEVLSERGAKVGVVNWMTGYPAVDINGFMLTTNQGKSPYTFAVKYSEDFDLPPEKILLPPTVNKGNDRLENLMARLTQELEDLRRSMKLNHNLDDYKGLFMYVYAIDGIQHYFWADFKDRGSRLPSSSIESGAMDKQPFALGWEKIDKLIGEINQEIDGNTAFCILSDHGSRPILNKETMVNTEKILEALGCASPKTDEDAKEPIITAVNEDLLSISGEMSDQELKQLAHELRTITFRPSKKPVYSRVRILERKDGRFVNMQLTRPLKVRPKHPQNIRIKGKDYTYDEIVKLHPWSGRHRARGIIIIKGANIKNRFIGAWVFDSPYTFLFRLLHGRAKRLDRIYPLLKFFHLADPITTLDITPTLLNWLGYPRAEDMDGRDFTRQVARRSLGRKLSPVKSYGPSAYYDATKRLDKKLSKKIEDEMRALGYIK